MAARKIRVVQPTDKVRVTFGAGDEYRYLATGDDTDGGYYLVDAIIPPGGGPPFHIQTREEEAFYVLEGELSFYGDDGEIVAGPGTYLNIPKARSTVSQQRPGDGEDAVLLYAGRDRGLFDELAKMQVPAGDFSSVIKALNGLGEGYGVEYLSE